MISHKNRWWFSFLLLGAYLSLFLIWKAFPSREAFLIVGFGMAGLLTVGWVVAAKQRYFVNRTDFVLHGLVILDVVLETVAFELFLQGVVWAKFFAHTEFAAGVLEDDFHANNNFYFCGLAFAV
ncbi:MAG: hypothetical protein KDA84_29490, partial [Planctomycetaceae bacterium]|nr:hypothetical protein [Planctomycetaceae bacterium]